ncbi:hypothetical protein [Globicatella sanguinis]
MDKQKFIDKISHDYQKTNEDKMILDALELFKSFVSSLQSLANDKFDPENVQFSSMFKEIKVGNNILKPKRKNETVEMLLNNSVIDKWYVQNQQVMSEKFNEIVSDNLFEKYLDLF